MTPLFTPLRNVLPMRPGAMRNAHQAVTPGLDTHQQAWSLLCHSLFLSNSIGWQSFFIYLFFLILSHSALLEVSLINNVCL